MIQGVPQGVKIELARRIFAILDARPFQIMAERFSLWENAVKHQIRRCPDASLPRAFKSRHDLRVKRQRLQPPIFGVLRPHCNMRIRRIQENIGPNEGAKLLSTQASMRRS